MANYQIFALKLDFKIDENGILRIVDLGDGLSASDQGFDNLQAKLLRDIHSTTGMTLYPAFGELIESTLKPEAMHVPVLLRKLSAPFLEFKDVPPATDVMIMSEIPRLQEPFTYSFCGRFTNALNSPVSLGALEMHKIFWYFLMQSQLKELAAPKILYWNNFSEDSIDAASIDSPTGFFIKIVDRSQGGGDNVFYAKDKNELASILEGIKQQYRRDQQKHLFVIEPAYVTLRERAGKLYNVTGRAFISLVYNTSTKFLEIKIAAAKWIFPLDSMKGVHTSDQMLSNDKHSTGLIDLDASELENLHKSLVELYNTSFANCFDEQNLFKTFADHPQMPAFMACLRANSSYNLLLANRHEIPEKQDGLMLSLVHSLIPRFLNSLELALRRTEVALDTMELNLIIHDLCHLSFFENYIKQAKTFHRDFLRTFSYINEVLSQEARIQRTLHHLIQKYLNLKSTTDIVYDSNDFNKALRQSAFAGDFVTMKLLIYSHRANVNAVSPTGKTAMDFAAASKNIANKDICLRLLQQAGALPLADILSQHLNSLNQAKGMNYDTTDLNKALRQAAYIGDVETVKLLVQSKLVDPNAKSPTGKTALQFATASNNIETKAFCINLLLQAGVLMVLTEADMAPFVRNVPIAPCLSRLARP